MKKNRVVFVLALLLAGSLLVFSGCRDKKSSKKAPAHDVKTEMKKGNERVDKDIRDVKKAEENFKSVSKDASKR